MTSITLIAGLGSMELIIISIILLVSILPLIYGIYLVYKSDYDISTKLLWILLFLVAPLIGVIVFLLFQRNKA